MPVLQSFSKPPTLPNSGFDYILMMFYILNRYISFPVVHPLDTVMCIQMLNNGYGILVTGLYCWALGVAGRSTVYSEVTSLTKNCQISCKKMCVPIFIASSFQSTVRCDSYSNWLIVCYLTRHQTEGIFWTSSLCRMIMPKMQNALTVTFLILKEGVILLHESNTCMSEKTTYQ